MRIEESEEVKQAHQSLYDALELGSIDAVEDLYSQDPQGIFIGTEGEVWLSAKTRAEDNRKYIGDTNKIESKGILARQHGNIGWSTDEFVHHTATGEAFHARASLVWIKESDGKWRIVYSHSEDLDKHMEKAV